MDQETIAAASGRTQQNYNNGNRSNQNSSSLSPISSAPLRRKTFAQSLPTPSSKLATAATGVEKSHTSRRISTIFIAGVVFQILIQHILELNRTAITQLNHWSDAESSSSSSVLLPPPPPPPIAAKATTQTQTTAQPAKLPSLEQRKGHHVVFYNVYNGPNVEGNSKLAAWIIKDQLGQIATDAQQEGRYNTTQELPIYYNLIGPKHRNVPIPSSVCPGCRFLQHFEQAGEDVTLLSLWQHCRKNPLDRVTYIHNKGSYSNNMGNIKTRRMATKAVFSNECQRMEDFGCNTCSVKYNYVPHTHYSSNMWTAECGYIQHLPEPTTYGDRRRQFCSNYTFPIPQEGGMNCPDSTSEPNDQKYGFARYANERWLFAHPSIEPCHVFEGPLSLCDVECDWEPRLISTKWFLRRYKPMHWKRLMFALEEYKHFYGTYGDFCERLFADMAENPCEMDFDVTKEETIIQRLVDYELQDDLKGKTPPPRAAKRQPIPK